MSAAAPAVIPFGDAERLAEARRLVLAAAETLRAAAGELDAGFLAAVDAVDRCDGTVFVTGVGKAGLIGAKLAATLSSLGVPSRTLHPVDAVHGDLGGVGPG
ncbi:MAG: KpsF/GutQ family sugar-phosphate isomerase, partial [Planctomycetota bacterium]